MTRSSGDEVVSETVRVPVSGGVSVTADVGGPVDGPTVVLLHGGGPDPPLVARHLAGAGRGRLAGVVGRPAGPRRQRLGPGRRLLPRCLRRRRPGRWPPRCPPRPCSSARRSAASRRCVAVADSTPQTDTARGLVLVDVAHRLEESGRERIGDFMIGSVDGFASLEEAADAIAAYNPHRPRPDGPVRAGQEPAPARRRPLDVALGPRVRAGQVRLGRRDPLVGGRPRAPRRGRSTSSPSRPCWSGAAAATC